MDIKNIRYNLIDVIMQTTDFAKLAAMYEMAIGGKTATKETKTVEVVETVVKERVKEIPVAEIKKGVTLEEIKASQKTSNMTYEEFSKMVAEEEWEQSLEELLDSLD